MGWNMIQTINKSLLEADTKYIAHQCNCTTTHSAGIAKAIFDRYPWANTYKNRKLASVQGTIDIIENRKPYVINMYIQYYPGKAKLSNLGNLFDSPFEFIIEDSAKNRINYLRKCLNKISEIENIESIGFPEGMGCRLAKGNWNDIRPILEEFAEKIYKEQNAQTFLYKYDNRTN